MMTFYLPRSWRVNRKNKTKNYIVQMFKNSFRSSRSSSWDKDLLLHVNPYKTLKDVHTKIKTNLVPIGRRGGLAACQDTYRWVHEPGIGDLMFFLRYFVFGSCMAARWSFYIVTLSLPELVLYPLTFSRIIQLTNTTASTGTLKSG